MISVHLLLLILAFVAFVAAACSAQTGRLNLIGFGLACWVLTILLPLLT